MRIFWNGTRVTLVILLITGFFGINKPTPYSFPDLLYFPEMPVAVDNPVTKEGAELGRYLFYDPILSANYKISCATCHKQSRAFSDSPQQLSKGIQGELLRRNTPPLFNLAWYPVLFWDGMTNSIEEQVFHPVRDHEEMNLDWPVAMKRIQQHERYPAQFQAAFGSREIDSTLIAQAIAQFERTLLSYNSKYDQAIRRETILSPQEYTGFVLMNDQTKGDCLHCHTTDADVLGTTTKFSNNGLDPAQTPRDYSDPGKGGISGNEEEMGWFRIPSLRNVALTAPYMHDGRFQTLEEVLDFYSEGLHNSYNIDPKMGFVRKKGASLSQDEKNTIIAFLNALTDSVFITNPEFSDPFL